MCIMTTIVSAYYCILQGKQHPNCHCASYMIEGQAASVSVTVAGHTCNPGWNSNERTFATIALRIRPRMADTKCISNGRGALF